MKAKGLLIGVLVLSLAANAWLAFTMMDGAVALDDRDRQAETDRRTIADLQRMADRLGRFPARPRAERAMKAMFDDPYDVVKWEGDTLWVNEVALAYRGDSVVRVDLMNEVN